jgi:macrolide transport system ATP-binding/permease protein
MISLFRKVQWWLQRRHKEEQLREELQFHLAEEIDERQTAGLPADDAAWAARRDLGNATLVQEDARMLWSWMLVEQLAQDVRYGLRGMFKNRLFTGLAALSLALGIGANTAIYSFMDSILLRSLPVADPASLVVVKWRSRPVNRANGDEFVMRSMDGSTYRDGSGVIAAIFPFPAFERLHEASASVLSSLFAHKRAENVNVIVKGEAELAQGEYVSGDFFRGLAILPAAGRLIVPEDDRPDAAPVAVLSLAYSQSRFGDAASAVGQPLLINNVPFTVVGVAPAEFFGVDPAATPHVYLPMDATTLLLQQQGKQAFGDQNYYWVEMMGRLKPGVDLTQAQAALAGPFGQWVASTAANDRQRANLPALRLEEGAAGLDSLRRQYSKPLYVLLTMVGLILAIACANTANLLLARAAARTHEMAVRLSLGAGRWRVIRQLLTESVLLAALSGGLAVLIAVVSMRALTQLLANGQPDFTLHAELNWHVLVVTLALSLLCGVLFGLAPALHATRPTLLPALRERSVSEPGGRLRATRRRVSLTQALVVGQIAISMLLLVAAGLFVRTLSTLHSIPLGFNRDNVLLFDVNALQAGYPAPRVADFYADLRRRLGDVSGVQHATLSHASLIRAGRSHPVTINGQRTQGTRILWTGPRFFTTMQIPILRGREITESDRQGTLRVAVVSELFVKTNFGDADPVGRHIEVGGLLQVGGLPSVLEIVGVAANVRYGGLKGEVPPVVYVSHAQVPAPELGRATYLGQVTYALRTEGDPLRYAGAVRQLVREADGRVPITNLKTQAADIDQTINQEIVFARLCSAFAFLALTIACVGLYATMAYAVTRRTGEIGLRLALGAGRGAVIWMILRDVCVLAAVGLAIGASAALAASRLVESFLFETKPNDPRAVAVAAAILLTSALAAGYGPGRRASRLDPLTALRHE